MTRIYATRDGPLRAVERVSFDIRDGEFGAIVGPSGCGKTTLLKMIAGLVPANTGEIDVFGKTVRGPYGNVGMVFQAPVLMKWRSVLDNVLFPIEIIRRPRSEFKVAARDILRLVGLEGFERKYPHQLSGGMQQRVAIARALIHDPSLLLLDEPFGALDQLTREQMNLELLRIWSESRKTTVLITHSISEAVFLADRVVVMTPRPGQVAEIVVITLPRPRRPEVRFTPEFNDLVQRVGRLLGI